MNLLKALATISSMTLLSRILGFVRDFVIARTFGAGLATDAFFVAFKLPNLLRRMFAEGAFAQAFVPILGEYKMDYFTPGVLFWYSSGDNPCKKSFEISGTSSFRFGSAMTS